MEAVINELICKRNTKNREKMKKDIISIYKFIIDREEHHITEFNYKIEKTIIRAWNKEEISIEFIKNLGDCLSSIYQIGRRKSIPIQVRKTTIEFLLDLNSTILQETYKTYNYATNSPSIMRMLNFQTRILHMVRQYLDVCDDFPETDLMSINTKIFENVKKKISNNDKTYYGEYFELSVKIWEIAQLNGMEKAKTSVQAEMQEIYTISQRVKYSALKRFLLPALCYAINLVCTKTIGEEKDTWRRLKYNVCK